MQAKKRPEIDGLRALAVLPVVFFHTGIPGFSGGFVGVDVFFVISGYLITQIIQREIEQGQFSLLQFYERRARRILPALLFVTLVAFILAWNLFLPTDFYDFCQSVFAVATFSSNILFWMEAGYFDSAANVKPLLHTWSLAIEEQFYLLFPLLLMLLAKSTQLQRMYVIGAILAASFLLSVWGVSNYPGATFYLLPMRTWELATGAMLALCQGLQSSPFASPGKKEMLGVIGVLAILIPVAVYDMNTPFPGFSAFLPCLGAALIIYSTLGKASTRVGRFLRNSLLVKTGLISYSLYLWHWIFAVFARYYLIRPLTLFESAMIICVSFVMAYFSWLWIEAPFRSKRVLADRHSMLTGSVVALAVLGLMGASGHLYNGFPQRIPGDILAIEQAATFTDPRRENCHISMTPERVSNGELCKVGTSSSEPEFLVWGDSHAMSLYSALDIMSDKYQISGEYASNSGCLPVLDIDVAYSNKTTNCKIFNESMLAHIKDREIRNVFLVARWALYTEGKHQNDAESQQEPVLLFKDKTATGEREFRRLFSNAFDSTISELLASSVNVWVVRSIPEQSVGPRDMALATWLNRKISDGAPRAEFEFRQKFIGRLIDHNVSRVHSVDPASLLCKEHGVCRLMSDGSFLYYDNNHLNLDGAKYVAASFDTAFEEIAGKAGKSAALLN